MIENSGLPIKRSDVDLVKIISTGTVELAERIKPALAEIEAVSDLVIENVQVKILGDAGTILGEMTGQLKHLQTDKTNSYLPFQIRKIWTGAERLAKEKIIERKKIKTTLEEYKARYEATCVNLRENIATCIKQKDAAYIAAQALGGTITQMEEEKSVLEQALIKANQENMREMQMAIQRYDSAINNTKGIKFAFEGTVFQAITQQASRETLYTTLTTSMPALDVLLKQQLAMLIGQAEISTATKMIEDFQDGINKLASENARMMHEDAMAVARVANQPIITEKTINEMAGQIVGTLVDVDRIIQEEIAKGKTAALAAENGTKTIRDTINKLSALKGEDK